MRYAFAFVLLTAAICFGDPHYVDLGKVATTSLENDGNTGWANEGINDMFVYPPIPHGEVTRNGYKFNLPKPTNQLDKTVVMLKGEGLPKLPAEVTASVANAKGKYVYFLQNSVKK